MTTGGAKVLLRSNYTANCKVKWVSRDTNVIIQDLGVAENIDTQSLLNRVNKFSHGEE